MGVPDIVSAGGVVTRPGREVLVVHRPRYDDWSLPKGKVDRGEHPLTTAVRELREETGLAVRLGTRLHDTEYDLGDGRDKRVLWWSGRVHGSDDVAGYRFKNEIDEVRWVDADKADELLDSEQDRRLVKQVYEQPRNTRTLLVVRHAKARSRKRWKGEDHLRTLTAAGERQASRLLPLMSAYGVTRAVSSSSTRCLQTLEPYAARSKVRLRTTGALSEEKASTAKVRHVVQDLMAREETTMLCSHRPVLPLVFAALDMEAVALEPGAFVAVHHKDGKVVSTEVHSLLVDYDVRRDVA